MRKKPKGDTWDGIFADPEVGRVLHANGLITDANKSSIEELATITSLNPDNSWSGSYFHKNKAITQFPEFQYCTGLTELFATFSYCSSLTTVVIPEGVTILNNTFTGCSSLTTAPIIPEGVTELRDTFNSCTNLTTAQTISEGVINMDSTFSGCSSLTKAPVLPKSVTDLSWAFYGCSSLITAPVIPEGVTILEFTFFSCTSLDGIYIINAVTPPSYSRSLENVQAIYVPDYSVDTYKGASGWTEFASKIYKMSQYPK